MLKDRRNAQYAEAKKTQSQEAFNLAFELEAAQIEIENLKKRQQEMQQLLSNEIMAGTLEDASKADYKSVIQRYINVFLVFDSLNLPGTFPSLRFENSTLREQNRTLTAENLKLQDQQKDWFKLKDKISKFKAGILLKKKVKQPPTLNGATGERIKIEDNSAKVQPLPPNIQDILAPLNESSTLFLLYNL